MPQATAGQASQPAAVLAASAAPSAASSSAPPAPCLKDSDCPPAKSACARSTCGPAKVCVLQPARGQVECQLSPELGAVQDDWHWSQRKLPGICRGVDCVPRLKCAEDCTVGVAREAQARISPQLAKCDSEATPAGRTECQSKIGQPGSAEQQWASLAINRCLLACGYPAVDLDVLQGGRAGTAPSGKR
jgi:hypothetical protein